VNTSPYNRIGIGLPSNRESYLYTQSLNTFRRDMQTICSDCTFQCATPLSDTLRNDEQNEKTLKAMCIFFITCQPSIEKSYAWEKQLSSTLNCYLLLILILMNRVVVVVAGFRFITATSSTRGQATYMVGKGDAKAEKTLVLPSMKDRKPRIDLNVQFQTLISKRRGRGIPSPAPDVAEPDFSMLAALNTPSVDVQESQSFLESSQSTFDDYNDDTKYLMMNSAKTKSNLHKNADNDEDEDYQQLVLLHKNKAKIFQDALKSGDLLNGKFDLKERANINPISSATVFDPVKARQMEQEQLEREQKAIEQQARKVSLSARKQSELRQSIASPKRSGSAISRRSSSKIGLLNNPNTDESPQKLTANCEGGVSKEPRMSITSSLTMLKPSRQSSSRLTSLTPVREKGEFVNSHVVE
jgi:hypothetical protein